MASDNGSAKEEFDDGLDDDLIGDDEDRARLEKMTEREREQELFKRAENRENLRKRFEIQKKLKQQQKLKGEKAKSSSEDELEEDYSQMLDAKERSQDRRKNLDAIKFDKKSTALSELKARKQERERKEQERKERKEAAESKESGDEEQKSTAKLDRIKKKSRRDSSSSSSGSYSRRRSSSSSSSSASSSGGESDTERFDSGPQRKVTKKYIETQEDLEAIRLSRFKMERFVHLPFFKKLVVGCFVRVGIGNSPDGRSVYRCTEIADVVETAKVYQMGRQRTNVGLRLRFGKQERVFRLEFISNSPLTLSEFEKWKVTCDELGISLPTKDFVSVKAEEIRKAMNYEFSSADIDAILEKKEKFSKNPVNYAMTKARLMKEREIALAEHDHEKANELETKLNELEQRAEELDKRRTERSSISSVSFINNRNRKNNVEKAEQAILEDIKRKEKEGVEANPFTRRKCNPRMVTKNSAAAAVNDQSAQMLQALAEETARVKEKRPQPEVKRKAKDEAKASNGAAAASGKAKKPKLGLEKTKEDLFDAHDFDIEIDVDAVSMGNGPGAAATSSAPVNVGGQETNSKKPVAEAAEVSKTMTVGPAKRSLNLSDYKKKRGLI